MPRQLKVVQAANASSREVSSKPPQPDLHQSQLDWDALDCVLADFDDLTAIVQIQGRDAQGAEVALVGIVDARDKFVSGSLQALQVVYHFADQVWCDTLLREPTGARLLRMLNPARAE